MAFVAEDGTGLANANSLCDVAFANAYFADRLVTLWDAKDDDVKQAALIAATDYVELRWAERFRGCEQFADTPQALSFPRTDIGWDGAVPDGIKKAVAEYALRTFSGKLAPDVTTDAGGFPVASVRRKVGPIETATTYTTSGSAKLFKPYPAADMLVRPFLRSVGGLVRS